jgi:Short C-terminal domain
MYGRGPFWGGRYMRRRGFPLMGGFGMGMGGFGGGSLLGDLAAGGIGYLMGKQSAQQTPQYQTPQYQPPQTPQYQTPQYQAAAVAPNQQATTAGGTNERLAQIKLLGHLRDSGLLTNDEFEAEKQKILQGY